MRGDKFPCAASIPSLTGTLLGYGLQSSFALMIVIFYYEHEDNTSGLPFLIFLAFIKTRTVLLYYSENSLCPADRTFDFCENHTSEKSSFGLRNKTKLWDEPGGRESFDRQKLNFWCK